MRLGRFARLDALFVTAAIWFLGKFLRYAFPPLFETLSGTYGVSRTALGTAFTGFMLVYALMQFPSGLLADQFGSVRVIAGGGLVTVAGALVLVVDSPFAVLAAAMLLMGAGTGAHKTVAVRLLTMIYPKRTGRALGILDTIAGFGGVAAPAAVVAVLPNWRGLFLATGIVGIALAVLFRVTNRALHDEPLGTDPGADRAATAPFPGWLDAERGRAPSMVPADEFDGEIRETVTAFQRFHGFEDGLPSIYRCLAQWPSLFETLWADLGPVLESDTFATACDRADERTDAFVDGVPYSPRLAPDALRTQGFDDERISDVQRLFREFDEGAVGDVIPGLHLWAATVGSVGEREW
jgi:hypothetical protein